MNRTLPTIAMLLGIGGLIPFAVCSFGALSLAPEEAARALLALTAYAAVILGFLGGVHWGFGLDGAGAPPAVVQRGRFGLGVLPALIGWAGLLLAIVGLPRTALMVEAVGFIATTVVEARASRDGWMPKGYMGLRWVLSVVVIVLLISVWLVLTLGGRVVL
ncbi:MAG: hypothetical protein NVSMB18_08100 [Acetobacteraceae bacterium]